jgi:hypothetical protein
MTLYIAIYDLQGDTQMDLLDIYGIQASFDTVWHMIDREQIDMTENSKAKLERSIGFMDNVIKSIDSLGPNASYDNQGCYYFTPNLKEIISIPEKKISKISKDALNESKSYFSQVKSNLALLQTEPQKFYASGEAENLKDIIGKIINIYSDEPYIVEKNIALAERI